MKQHKHLILKASFYLVLSTLVVGSLLAAKRQAFRFSTEGKQLIERKYDLETLIKSKEIWETRANWVEANIPRFYSRTNAYENLITTIEKGLKGTELKLENKDNTPTAREIFATEVDGLFEEATAKLIVTGKESDIVHWMHRLQQQENFISIDHIALELKAINTLRCEVQISQWFSRDNRTLQALQHYQPKIHDSGPRLVDRF